MAVRHFCLAVFATIAPIWPFSAIPAMHNRAFCLTAMRLSIGLESGQISRQRDRA